MRFESYYLEDYCKEEAILPFVGSDVTIMLILMRIFRDMEMVEALGSGMLRILRSCGPTNYEFGDNYIRLIISFGVSSKGTEQSTAKIVGLMKQNPKITIAELSERLGLSDKGVRKNITTLKKACRIRRVGPDKGGYWEVLKVESL